MTSCGWGKVRRVTSRFTPCHRAALLACVVAPVLSILAPSPAHAQLFRGESQYQTDRGWAVELRMGPYSPDVDSEFDPEQGPGPHEKYFTTKRRLMVQAELDRELLSVFGTLSVGARIGYTRETASAFVDPNFSMGETVRSGDRTSLTIVPTSLLLVYRLDVAARRWGIPLVPYGKVGLDYVLYWIRDGNDSIASFGGNKGRGGTTGWNAAIGVAFLLDVFDQGSARELDSTTGINHTYLFGELVHHDDSGLFGSKQMHLGDDTWFAGLMFEF